jgi:hypothetical protein
MEIPTEKVLESLIYETVTLNGKSTMKEATLMVSIATIKAQAKEIRDLQATICRLKEEHEASIRWTRDEAMRIVHEARVARKRS